MWNLGIVIARGLKPRGNLKKIQMDCFTLANVGNDVVLESHQKNRHCENCWNLPQIGIYLKLVRDSA